MKIKTKYFDDVLIEDKEIILFPDAIYGFNDEKKFLLISFEENNDNLLCMQSVNSPDLAFILMNPFSVVEEYSPKLSNDDIVFLGGNPNLVNEFLFYTLAVFGENSLVTINLRSPIVINPNNHTARQVILEDDKYSMRHPIKQK